jgi:hypothetical protein
MGKIEVYFLKNKVFRKVYKISNQRSKDLYRAKSTSQREYPKGEGGILQNEQHT